MTGPHRRGDEVGLVDRVTSALRHRVLAGEILAGAKLPSESELAGEFGVSRTVVREAVSHLRAAGVVETQQGRGSFVLDLAGGPSAVRFDVRSQRDLVHLMELRIAVEPEAAGLAARRRSAGHRASLDEAMAAFVRSVEDPSRVVLADFAFHLSVAEASRNPFVVELVQDIGPRAILLHRSQLGADDSAADAEHLQLLIHEHRSIHQAIVRADPEAARSAMQVHLRRSLSALGTDQP